MMNLATPALIPDPTYWQRMRAERERRKHAPAEPSPLALIRPVLSGSRLPPSAEGFGPFGKPLHGD